MFFREPPYVPNIAIEEIHRKQSTRRIGDTEGRSLCSDNEKPLELRHGFA